MTPSAIHQMIGRALTERSFRERLLLQPQVAVREFPLTESEQTQIVSLKALDLEEFSRLLYERLDPPGHDTHEGNGQGIAFKGNLRNISNQDE
jgi:hypothetical protein